MKSVYMKFLGMAASMRRFGLLLMRVAVFAIFFWIGGLKFFAYEANGIVPFVANSPFMNFFYSKPAPEYQKYKMAEGAYDEQKTQWQRENNTYGFSKGLGVLIMTIGTFVLLGAKFKRVGLVGEILVIVMTFGTLSFLVTTPEVWVPDLGGADHGFPFLSGAGRLVIKDIAILAGGIILLSDTAASLLKNYGGCR